MGITSIDGIDHDQMAAWVGEERGWIWSSRYAHWDLLPGEHTVEVTGRVWETDEGKVRWWLWGWAVEREAWDSIAPHSQLCVSVPDTRPSA